MPGSMARADLVADLKASLMDAAALFRDEADDAAFHRHLAAAALAFGPHRATQAVGSITLEAGRDTYAAPADLWRFVSAIWGTTRSQPWERAWPGRLPTVRVVGGDMLLLPAPTQHQISALGAAYRFFYSARPVVADDAAATTLDPADRALLIQRAQVEAMRELAMRDSVRPSTVRDGFSGQPKTGTPGWIAQSLLDDFHRRVVQ